jgi:hypothetical protein
MHSSSIGHWHLACAGCRDFNGAVPLSLWMMFTIVRAKAPLARNKKTAPKGRLCGWLVREVNNEIANGLVKGVDGIKTVGKQTWDLESLDLGVHLSHHEFRNLKVR